MRRLFLILGLAVVSMGFKGLGDDEPIVRPMDPFVFRTTLDDHPRMISLALHPDLWVAYDAANGTLYKAWNGRIKFEGPVFNGNPTANPSVDGYPFIEYPQSPNRWRLVEKGDSYTPEVHFKGYSIKDNKLTFRYELEQKNGERIIVTEYPEYKSKRDGKLTGLIRQYTTTNVPKGVEVRLQIEYDALLLNSDLKTDGKFYKLNKTKRHFDWGTLYSVEGQLILNANEATELATFFAMNPETVSSSN
jgi:cytochrome c